MDLPSEYHSDHTTEYDSPEETVIVTQDGQLGIVHFSLVKKSRCKKSIKCPICGQDFDSTCLHNKHMRDKHPTFHYACSKDGCEKEFNTRNAAYKHVQKHYFLCFGCSMCGKRFQFPYQQQNHIKTHTGKGKIPCTWPKCKKMFTCNKNMFQHLQAHTDERFFCEVCDPTKTDKKYLFPTYSNLRQHKKGFHEGGFKALCRLMEKWPYLHAKHQRKCDACTATREQMQNSPMNP